MFEQRITVLLVKCLQLLLGQSEHMSWNLQDDRHQVSRQFGLEKAQIRQYTHIRFRLVQGMEVTATCVDSELAKCFTDLALLLSVDLRLFVV